MTLDNKKGNTAIGQITAECKSTYLSLDNAKAGDLAAAISANTSPMTYITVTSGTINDDDWAAIKNNRNTMLYLDLEGVSYPEAEPTFNGESSGQYPLQTAKLPQGIVGIGKYAFYYCTSLTTIDIPEGVTSIENCAFTYCSSLTSIVLPDGLTTIGSYAFSNCSSLTSIVLPDGLTSIGSTAFNFCSSLTSIDIPATVTTIEESAFANCSSLTSIDIPATVTTIRAQAFYNCSALKTVTCLAETPPTLGTDVFLYCTLTAIQVPAGAVEAYQEAAGWSEHADKITAIP